MLQSHNLRFSLGSSSHLPQKYDSEQREARYEENQREPEGKHFFPGQTVPQPAPGHASGNSATATRSSAGDKGTCDERRRRRRRRRAGSPRNRLPLLPELFIVLPPLDRIEQDPARFEEALECLLRSLLRRFCLVNSHSCRLAHDSHFDHVFVVFQRRNAKQLIMIRRLLPHGFARQNRLQIDRPVAFRLPSCKERRNGAVAAIAPTGTHGTIAAAG